MQEHQPHSTILLLGLTPALAARLAGDVGNTAFVVHTAKPVADPFGQVKQVQPDLLICDLDAPGIGGKQLVEHLRSDPATEQVCVMVIGTQQQMFLPSGAEKAYPDAMLDKPLDYESLLRLIRECLRALDASA